MLALGAPLILLHACDYISQNTVPGSGNYARDVVLFDMFCGKEALTQAYREHGLKTLSYDVELQPETHDLTSTSGWLRGLQYTPRLVEQGLLHGGPPCGTFVFINRATSKRSSVDADGDPCVRSVGIANTWMSTWGSLTAKPSMCFGVVPFAAGLYRKLSKAKREKIKQRLLKMKLKIVHQHVDADGRKRVTGLKSLKSTQVYPKKYGKRVRKLHLKFNEENPGYLRKMIYDDDPYPTAARAHIRLLIIEARRNDRHWQMADLEPIRAFLRSERDRGAFTPVFDGGLDP